MKEVFISYKSNHPELGNNDETVANELCHAIEAAGISCWIAPRDIEPGVRYGRAIMEAINSCKVMVVVFSKHANTSEHIANEVDAIFSRKVDIIPFNIDGSQPGLEFEYYLRRMQWIDASGDYRKTIPELIKALKHKLGKRDFTLSTPKNDSNPSQSKPIVSTSSIRTFTVNGVSFNMVHVEGGTFMMGANPENDSVVGDIVHKEVVSSFLIGETQVTQKLWQSVMGVNPSYFNSDLQNPVERVSWEDCQVFLKKLNALTGKKFRLPSEAEWEFAARGGNLSKGYIFAGSNNLNDIAWHKDNSDDCTHPVSLKKANELGLYDMNGNVWEWCEDSSEEYLHGRLFISQSLFGEKKKYHEKMDYMRVCRGGSWRNDAVERCFYNIDSLREYPNYRFSNIGLRLALTE